MIYKFNSANETDSTFIEFTQQDYHLEITIGDYETDVKTSTLYLSKYDIDEMIIALSNIKREITEAQRDLPK